MSWGIGIGILIVAVLFVVFGFIMFKETRTHRFWRSKVEEGDTEMITQLVRVELERWRTEGPPKGMSTTVWTGVQGVELVEAGRDQLHVSSTAEPQFALVGGGRRQVSSTLDEGKRITAALAERFLYDIPHVRPERVQIDIYATFGEPAGEVSQSCILSTPAQRSAAAEVDWENDPPEVITEMLGARYRLDGHGGALPIDLDEEDARAGTNGSRGDGQREGPERVL
jgi:hypothetical protein